MCDISGVEFEKVYKRLDVTVQECGQSFYNNKIPPAIEEFQKTGFISVEEGGAKCVFVDDPFHIPLILQKSDGGSLFLYTTHVTYIRYIDGGTTAVTTNK